MCISVYLYNYICIYIYRERERDKEKIQKETWAKPPTVHSMGEPSTARITWDRCRGFTRRCKRTIA